MNIVVRYCSKTKFGNTRRIAEAIADGIGVKAVSIADEPKLQEKADILFLGGAPYANIMAPELKAYAEDIDPKMVSKVVLFTTSNWSKRTVLALKKMLKGKGISVSEDYFYAHMLNIDGKLEEAKEFGKKMSIDRRL
ncbi:MAG: flavodoxin [Butyrivibrio hungatei]|nr:flavodoxin [Butyrivibrio hungatei]